MLLLPIRAVVVGLFLFGFSQSAKEGDLSDLLRFAAAAILAHPAGEETLATLTAPLDEALLARSASNAARIWYWRLRPEERRLCIRIVVQPYADEWSPFAPYTGPERAFVFDGSWREIVDKPAADGPSIETSDDSGSAEKKPPYVAGSLANVISKDLEQIFGLTGTSSGQPRALVALKSHRFRALEVSGAIAAAGVLGLTIGAFMSHRPAAPKPPGQIFSFSSAAPLTGGRPTSAVPPMARIATRDVPKPGVSGVTKKLAAAAPDVPSRPRAHAPSPNLGAASQQRYECDARCTYEDVLVADARLRTAYAGAKAAGVPQPILVAFRNRWNRLRAMADSRPDHTATLYIGLAADLENAARRARDREVGYRANVGGSSHLWE